MYPPLLRSVLVLGLISVAFMIVDRSTDWLQPLRYGTEYLSKPFYWALEVPKRIEQWGVDTFASKTDLINENHSLRQERLIYRGRLQRMSELAAENSKASWLAVDGALELPPGRERASCGDERGAGRSELMRRPPGPRRVTGTSTMCGRSRQFSGLQAPQRPRAKLWLAV